MWLNSVYSIFHYGIPEKQTRSRMVWIAREVVFISMQITYPFHQTEISWLLLSISLHLHLHVYANYPSFSGFCWRQKWHLWFPRSDACLFGHPVHLNYQDFLRFTSEFSFQHFKAGKLSWWLIFNIKIIICL